MVDILQASQLGDDDKAVLTRICVMLRARLQAATVAFFAADCGSFVPLVWDGSSRLDPEIANRVGAARQTIGPHAHHDADRGRRSCSLRWRDDWSVRGPVDARIISRCHPRIAAAHDRRDSGRPSPRGCDRAPDRATAHDPVELLGASPAMAEVRRAVERARLRRFPCSSKARAAAARSLSPARCTAGARGGTGRSAR